MQFEPVRLSVKLTPEDPEALLTVMYCGLTEAFSALAVKLTAGELVAEPPLTETLRLPVEPLEDPPTTMVTLTVWVPVLVANVIVPV